MNTTPDPLSRSAWLQLARWRRRVRRDRVLRVALSHYVLNGIACAIGLLLVSVLMHTLFGAAAAANATVGVIATLAADVVGPRRGKLKHMVVAPLLGVPLFLAVQLLREHPVQLGLLLVPATFLAFLIMAWGKRGGPVAIGVMLAMIFALSTPPVLGEREALLRTAHCAAGAALYVVYSVLINLALNGRYRTLLMADLLLAMAALLHAHARRVAAHAPLPPDDPDHDTVHPMGDLLQRQAALADQLQATRDVVLESPRTARRQRLAGMLMVVLEMRDHLVTGELDLDRVRGFARQVPALDEVANIYRDMARDVEGLADALLRMRQPAPALDHSEQLAALSLLAPAQDTSAAPDAETTALDALLRGMASRLRHQNDAVRQLGALARGDAAPDLAVVRTSWQLFVSRTDWSLQPFLAVWRWNQPALRHAVRAALALGTGYVIATLLPWGSHDYWVLLTIVVVLRGSLAQTLERRDARVAGTVLGSLLAVGLLSLHPSTAVLLLTVTIAQGIAHGFALRRYLVTAVAASVLGLVQSQLMLGGSSLTFAMLERVGDTLLGAAIAWAFCYVLPSWERGQLSGLVRRVRAALARHARLSLGLSSLQAIDNQPELAWRLARREAYDALSALVQATERALVEPRAVRPPLALLEQLQSHSYQLLGQLSAIKSMLVLRRDHLRFDEIAQPVEGAAAYIQAALQAPTATDLRAQTTGSWAEGRLERADTAVDTNPLPARAEALPDPFEHNISPWLLRRLRLATGLADDVRHDALRIDQALKN